MGLLVLPLVPFHNLSSSSSHRAATEAWPFPCPLLTPLIKISLSPKSLFEQTSAILEGKEGMSLLLQACRVAENPSHVLTVLLTAEALWMHGIITSDKPFLHRSGSREGCLGHFTNKEAAPNESISAPLPLQDGRKKPQSTLKSDLTSQQSCLLCSVSGIPWTMFYAIIPGRWILRY